MKSKEHKVLKEFKRKVCSLFPDAEIILFGSKARGEDIRESDTDILILLEKYSPQYEDKIRDIAFETEMKQGVIMSLLIYAKDVWNSPAYRLLELYHWVEKEGIQL